MIHPNPTLPGRDFDADVRRVAAFIARDRLLMRPDVTETAELLGIAMYDAEFGYCNAINIAAFDRVIAATRLGLAVLGMAPNTSLIRRFVDVAPESPWAIFWCLVDSDVGEEWIFQAGGMTPLDALEAARKRSATP